MHNHNAVRRAMAQDYKYVNVKHQGCDFPVSYDSVAMHR